MATRASQPAWPESHTTPRPQPDQLRAAPLTILGHSIAHRGPTSHRRDGRQPGDEGGYTLLLGPLPEAQPPVLSPAQAVCFSCGRKGRDEGSQRARPRSARTVPLSVGAAPHSQGDERGFAVSLPIWGRPGRTSPSELILRGAPGLREQVRPSWAHTRPNPWSKPWFRGPWSQGQARPVCRRLGTPDPKGPPSESMQTVWCWPPEKPTQDLVEFLKEVRFWGTKQDSVPGVPGKKGQDRVVRREGVPGAVLLHPLPQRPPKTHQRVDILVSQMTKRWL